jgi:hypothetical protein
MLEHDDVALVELAGQLMPAGALQFQGPLGLAELFPQPGVLLGQGTGRVGGGDVGLGHRRELAEDLDEQPAGQFVVVDPVGGREPGGRQEPVVGAFPGGRSLTGQRDPGGQ